MRFESYAQQWEDLILYVALQDVQKVFYIDIGANDPLDLSVTEAFYRMGGNGINVEPLRSKCELLQCKRPRDINLCVGVGNTNGKLPFISAGTGSTFSDAIAERLHMEDNSRFLKRIMTLSEIHACYCDPKQEIHFCKIDVEGFEKQVLEGISDWNAFRPWIFVVESVFPASTVPCHKEWEEMLTENGYVFAYKTSIERYYVDERREYLLDRFGKLNEFVQNHEIVKMTMEPADCTF